MSTVPSQQYPGQHSPYSNPPPAGVAPYSEPPPAHYPPTPSAGLGPSHYYPPVHQAANYPPPPPTHQQYYPPPPNHYPPPAGSYHPEYNVPPSQPYPAVPTQETRKPPVTTEAQRSPKRKPVAATREREQRTLTQICCDACESDTCIQIWKGLGITILVILLFPLIVLASPILLCCLCLYCIGSSNSGSNGDWCDCGSCDCDCDSCDCNC